MRRAVIFLLTVSAWVLVLAMYSNAQGQRGATSGGWTIPANAASEKSPLTVNDAVIANGKKLFAAKCQRCHGPLGKGDGPDADAAHRHHMDLTSADTAKDNPDGVMFYRIWNGRTGPKMPTFSEDLSKEQVWTIVAYVQTLHGK